MCAAGPCIGETMCTLATAEGSHTDTTHIYVKTAAQVCGASVAGREWKRHGAGCQTSVNESQCCKESCSCLRCKSVSAMHSLFVLGQEWDAGGPEEWGPEEEPHEAPVSADDRPCGHAENEQQVDLRYKVKL